MATIMKKTNKSGTVYKIQVKLKDQGSGKIITKATTFKPPSGLTELQMERQATIFADDYEKQIRGIADGSNIQLCITPDTLFGQYADRWLQTVADTKSTSYLANCIYAKKIFVQYLGGYKLKDINPVIIQNFYDQLDKIQKTITKITAKDSFVPTLKAKNMRYTDLQVKHNIATTSLNSLLKGGTIGMGNAERIAKAMGVSKDKIFNISQHKEKLAFETTSKIKRTVRAILAQAKKQRLIQDNWASADFINFPKKPSKTINYLNDEQAKLFYATVSGLDDIRVRTAMSVLLFTGCRRGELCGLEWSDIDLSNATLTIRRSVVAVNGFGTITKEPKTDTSKRTLSIPSVLVKCLVEYKQWYDNMAVQLGDAWVHSDRLLVQWNGNPLSPGTVGVWLNKTLDKAGLAHITVHSIRHTNITLQIASGVPLVTVSGRAGHARTSTTTDIYSHLLKSSDRAAATALDNIFGTNE